MTDKVVVRYAPSPTGPQHIGGIRTALFSYLFAKKHNGEIILRIEDTDQTRFVPGAEEFIIEAIKWVGINFTQGVHIGGKNSPYRQSERLELYQKHAWELVEKEKAYVAFDTTEDIDAMKQKLIDSGIDSPKYNYVTRNQMNNSLRLSKEEVQKKIDAGEAFVIRMKIPPKEEIRFKDLVRDWVNIHSSTMDDKILLKSDGFPTYHLANVVDDHSMEVSHVIRGDEWISSTPLHVLMYRAFGWEETMPQFAHLPLLLNPDGSKMSKRNADKFNIPILPMNWKNPEDGEIWEGYKDLGYLPDAFINYLALLGWNPGDDTEIMDMETLIEKFSFERVGSAGARFDLVKLQHFNQQYIRSKADSELVEMYKDEIVKQGLVPPSDAGAEKIVRLLKERVTFPVDFIEKGRYFFESPTQFDEKTTRKKWKLEAVEIIKNIREKYLSLNAWEKDNLEVIFKEIVEEHNAGLGKVMAPLRLALTGVGGGPGIFEIAEYIGKEETIKRIDYAISSLPIGNQG